MLKRVDRPDTVASESAGATEGDKCYLAIVTGRPEADAIAFVLQQEHAPRPLSHDLMLDLATAFGIAIQEVRVTKLQDTTFYAAVVVRHGRQRKEIDARPSDALALALRAQVPIYVHTSVLQQAGIVSPEDAAPLLRKAQAEAERVLGRGPELRSRFVTSAIDEIWRRETVRLAERAVAVAQRLGHERLNTGHVLLALADLVEAEPASDLAGLFREDGLALAEVRRIAEEAAATGEEPDLTTLFRTSEQ